MIIKTQFSELAGRESVRKLVRFQFMRDCIVIKATKARNSLMANSRVIVVLLLLLLTTTTIMSASSRPPPPAAAEQEEEEEEEQQLNKIIDALIGAGDFNRWANMLSVVDPTAFPLWATFFIPSDSAAAAPLDSDRMALVMEYHIVPQRLSFSQLRLMKPLTRLPTLLPTKSILITNNSLSNFTLDHSLLSHPDLYITPAFAVHGIQSFLDYSLYGAAAVHTPFTPSHQHHPPPPPPQPPPPPPPPLRQAGSATESDSASLCSWDLRVLFLLLCGVWILVDFFCVF
ncbi:hypothetical protein ACOSQ3_011688 [Xanthoceras sorbifolium]